MVTESENEKSEIKIKDPMNMTIDGWQAYFHQIFSERNKDFTEGHQFMWLKVIEKATIVGEAIRKNDFNEASRSLARVFCWLCGFCSENKDIIGTDKLSDVIWYKYPRVCSTCAVKINEELAKEILNKEGLKCACDHTADERVNKKVNNEILEGYRLLKKPKTLDDWVVMFEAIFGHRLHIQSLDSICFHFVEEVGEVTTALRNYRENTMVITSENVDRDMLERIMEKIRGDDPKYIIIKTKMMDDRDFFDACQNLMADSIKEEVADVFSWLSALVIKLLGNRKCYTEYEERFFSTLFATESQDTFQPYYSKKRKPLNLSSIVCLEYCNGCPSCENRKMGNDRCTCETKMAPTII